MKDFILDTLPITYNFDTSEIFKKVIEANRALAELNGTVKIIPNENILINSLVLQEAKDSSEIENIITTHDELYKASIDIGVFTIQTKEVKSYADALKKGFSLIKENKLLLNRHIFEIQKELELNDAGIRKQIGTVLKNDKTGEIVYTPPQNEQEIIALLDNLEKYINEDLDDLNPLIKMAIIHYQFESIHPFYDGNGRTGRIINILYLVLKNLIDLPILYLSSYIISNKKDYYRLLQDVRETGNWKDWTLYMLDGIEKTSYATIKQVKDIKKLMDDSKNLLREKLPKIYSKDLLEILFSHPYTKIEFLVDYLGLHRETASNYLKILTSIGYLEEIKIGRNKYFVNIELFKLLKQGLDI